MLHQCRFFDTSQCSCLKQNVSDLTDCLYAAMPRSVGWSDVATMAGAEASSEDDDEPEHQQATSSSAQVRQTTPPKKLRMKNLLSLNRKIYKCYC